MRKITILTVFLTLITWRANAQCPNPSNLTTVNITTTSTDLVWTDNAGASLWDLEWGPQGYTQGTQSSQFSTTTTNNPYLLTGLTNGTSYDFYVRADCQGSRSDWILYNFTAGGPACVAPTALTTTNITATSTELGWTEMGTASLWDLEWGVPGFTLGTGTSQTNASTTNNPYLLTGLISGTSYEFYVRADCQGTRSAHTGPFLFTAGLPCNTPTTLTAVNITNTSVDLSWVEVGTATIWDIELGIAGFTPTGTATTANTTTNPTNVAGLTGGADYEFYVRSDCGADSSAWTGPYKFSTTSVGIDESAKKIGLSLYPNPNNGIFTLTIKAKNVLVEVMNTQGQVIFSKNKCGY